MCEELEMITIEERLQQIVENTEASEKNEQQSAFSDINNKKWMKTFTFLDP